MTVLRDYSPMTGTQMQEANPGLFPVDLSQKIASGNQLLQGATLRTSTAFGRTATVNAGEDIRPALESLKSAGGGTLILMPGVHRPTYNIVLTSNITLQGVGAVDTVIDFQNQPYNITNLVGTLNSVGTISISSGSKTVTGSGTTFLSGTTFTPGKTAIHIPTTGQWYYIASISSDTSMTLSDEFNGDALSGYGLFEIGDPTLNIKIKGLTITNNLTSDLVSLRYCHKIEITDCNFIEGASDGIDIILSDEIEVARCKFTDNANVGVYLRSCSLTSVHDCVFINNLNGVETSGTVDTSIVSCQFQGHNFFDIELNSGGNISIDKVFSSNSANGIYIGSPESSIHNSIIKDAVTIGLSIDTTNTQVIGCQFYYCGDYAIAAYTDYGHVISGCIFDANTANIFDLFQKSIVQGNFYLPVPHSSDILQMNNTSGGALTVGSVVILKSVAAGDEVTTTTTVGDDKVLGVAIETAFSNNTYGMVKTLGKVTSLKVDGTTDIAVGDFLSTYSVAGIAAKASDGDMAFAIALEAYTTNDSNGVIDALIIKPRKIGAGGTGTVPDTLLTKNTITANTTITAGYSAYIPMFADIADTITLDVGDGSYLEIG